jgi:hypothetical protein
MRNRILTMFGVISLLSVIALVATVSVLGFQPKIEAQSGTHLISMRDQNGDLVPAFREMEDGSIEQLNYDDHLKNIAEMFPGFAGVYRDPENPKVTVVLTNQPLEEADQTRILQGLKFVFGDNFIKDGGYRFELVRYDFPTLRGWYDELSPFAFGTELVHTGSVDEVNNSVVFGISDPAVAAEILSLASELGIPEGVVTFTESGPIQRRSRS